MLLRAQAFGQDPFRRFLVLRIDDRTLWDGETFTDEFDQALKFYRPSDACFAPQDILKEHYRDLPQRHFVVPVEICGARVQHRIDVCWNCGYGSDGDSTAYFNQSGDACPPDVSPEEWQRIRRQA